MRPSSMTPGHARAARLAYVVIVLLATLSNLHFDPSLADVPMRLVRAIDPTPRLSDAVDAVRNVLLFAGLGAVWVATSRLGKPSSTLIRVTIVSLFLSGCVEALQLFSPVRNSSVLDVMTDTIGGFVGGVVTLGAFAVIDEGAQKRSYIGIPAVLLAASYGLATVMEAFIPLFRQDLLPQLGGSIADRIGRAITAIRPESITQLPLIDGLIFFPAGVFAVVAMVESGMSASTSVVLVVCVATIMYPVVEVVHGVAAEPIILGAALVHVVGASLGAVAAGMWLAPFGRRVPIRKRAFIVAAAYALVILVWSWRPFRLDLSAAAMVEQFTGDHLIPLRALAARSDLFSVTDVISQGVIFFPLGALLAVWPLSRKGKLRGVLPAIYLAAILEIGKIPIANRFMDVTHIFIQSAGAALGFLLVRRLGYPVYGALLDTDESPLPGPDK
jgi:VanZ family protein